MVIMESSIKIDRTRLILQSILKNKRLTRNELAGILKLSPGAIVKYVKDLLDLGLIKESECAEANGAGRKALYLEFNPDRGVVVAVALYHTNIQAGLISPAGEIFAREDYPCAPDCEAAELLELLYQIVGKTLASASALGKAVMGIGIAMGGHIDTRTGISHEYLFAKNWYSVPVRDLVAEKFSLPVFLAKDTNACALGEQFFGEAVGAANFLSVWLGAGIGMGIVIGGENYAGVSGYAGELGHTRGGDASRLCYCGRAGCLEGATSQEYVIERCREGLKAGVMSSMKRLCGGDAADLRIEHVIAAAREGDRLSCGVFNEVGERLGLALCDVANLLNPELIIFRGPLIDGNDFLFEVIKRTTMNNCLHPTALGLGMRYAKQDDCIHLKGLCSLVLNGLIERLAE